MPNEARAGARTAGLPSALTWAGRWLLLVPEAALLAALLCLYFALGTPSEVALFAALLIVVFIMRTAALHLARASIEAGRYGEASILVRIALMLYPWSADALALQGSLALTKGQPDLAEAALRRAVGLLPGQPAFHTALSSALLEQGRPVEAARMALEALAIDGQHAQAYLYLAEAERASGAAALAVEERLRAGLVVASSPDAIASIQCALAAHLLSEHRVAEATLALHSAEVMLPRCGAVRRAELHFHLGELMTAQGNVDRAREHFQGVEALDPQGRYVTAAWRAAQL